MRLTGYTTMQAIQRRAGLRTVECLRRFRLQALSTFGAISVLRELGVATHACGPMPV